MWPERHILDMDVPVVSYIEWICFKLNMSKEKTNINFSKIVHELLILFLTNNT